MEDINKYELTQEKQDIILAKLKEKIKNYSCDVCGNNNWEAVKHIANIPLTNELAIRLGGQILPLFTIACTNCGHTRFFNLGILKLVDELTKDKKGKEDPK
jgi:predicted nucleic-acid-binding Zn-ribbon protein